jgi:hypothetical protein
MKKLLMLTILLCAGVWPAAQAASQWTVGTVKYVYPLGPYGAFYIAFTSDAGSTCTNASTPKYYQVNVIGGPNGTIIDGGAKAMLAVALSAFTTGATLAVNYDDSTSACIVSGLYIQ